MNAIALTEVPFTGIRRFSNEALQKSIDNALAVIPEGKSGAVVAYLDVDGSTQLAVAARLAQGWSIVGTLQHRAGYISGGAAVRGTW